MTERGGDLTNFKEEFVDREGIQFNCAGLTPLPTSVALEISRVVTVLQTGGALADPEMLRILSTARESIAQFLDADLSQVAFAPNCATALSQVALGFPLQSQDQVVTIDQEYSSSFYPWKVACDRSGAKLITVQSTQGRVTADDVIAVVKSGVKLVGVSWVQFQTGSILDLKRLGDHCRSVGAHLIVDAIQGLGQLPFSFRNLPVDFVASGSHKWMCGPLGQGFFAIKPELMEKILPVAVGGGTYNRFGTFADPDAPMEVTAKRFEAGGYSFLTLAGLGAAVKVLQEAGIQNIAAEISRLTRLLRAGLTERDVKLATPVDQAGGVTSFELPLEWEAKLMARAREEQITLAKRGPYVRTAIHAFSNSDEIDLFLNVLDNTR